MKWKVFTLPQNFKKSNNSVQYVFPLISNYMKSFYNFIFFITRKTVNLGCPEDIIPYTGAFRMVWKGIKSYISRFTRKVLISRRKHRRQKKIYYIYINGQRDELSPSVCIYVNLKFYKRPFLLKKAAHLLELTISDHYNI